MKTYGVWLSAILLLASCGGVSVSGPAEGGAGGAAGTAGQAGAGGSSGAGGACVPLFGMCDTSSACCSKYCESHSCIKCYALGQPCGAEGGECCSGACGQQGTCVCLAKGALVIGLGPEGEEWKICCSKKIDQDGRCL